jgi:hypothetical protein
VIEHGTTAEKDITPVRVGVTKLATPVSVEMHTVTADPPTPGL